MTDPMDTKPGSIQVLWRASMLLDALAASDRPMSLTDLFRQVGLHKSTALNILSTLCDLGLVAVAPDTRQYRLGARLLSLGNAFAESFHFTEHVKPFLARLRDATRETTSLHVRLGWERTCVAQAPSNQPIRRVIDVGRRRPLYTGAAGRILLGALTDEEIDNYLGRTPLVALTPSTETGIRKIKDSIRRTRLSGRAAVFSDTEMEVSAFAVPVRDHTGKVCAALVVSGPETRFNKKAMERAAPAIKQCAREVSRSFGWHGDEEVAGGSSARGR